MIWCTFSTQSAQKIKPMEHTPGITEIYKSDNITTKPGLAMNSSLKSDSYSCLKQEGWWASNCLPCAALITHGKRWFMLMVAHSQLALIFSMSCWYREMEAWYNQQEQNTIHTGIHSSRYPCVMNWQFWVLFHPCNIFGLGNFDCTWNTNINEAQCEHFDGFSKWYASCLISVSRGKGRYK